MSGMTGMSGWILTRYIITWKVSLSTLFKDLRNNSCFRKPVMPIFPIPKVTGGLVRSWQDSTCRGKRQGRAASGNVAARRVWSSRTSMGAPLIHPASKRCNGRAGMPWRTASVPKFVTDCDQGPAQASGEGT